METFYAAGLMVGALVQMAMAAPQVESGTTKPQLESVTFKMEEADRLEDITIQTTVYFSSKHEAYRYDFNGGQDKIFIYPKSRIAYYYYPGSDFRKHKFNFTICEYFPLAYSQELPNPIPSVDGFKYVGPDKVYDTSAELYTLDSEGTHISLWVEKVDPKTGIRQRPVRMAIKSVDSEDHLTRDRITEYFQFTVGEQDSLIWDRPKMKCLDATNRGIDIEIITGSLEDFGVTILSDLSQGDGYLSNSHRIRKYAKGRRGKIINDEDDKTGLLLPIPEELELSTTTLPKQFDWRDLGAVTGVKDQRQCGGCWAFGTVGSLEGAYFRKTGNLVSISEQALIDCAGTNPIFGETNGCFGGIEFNGYAWVKQAGGIPPTTEYPQFQEANGNCRVTSQTKLIAQLVGYHHIKNNTNSVKRALVGLGPLVVSIDSSNTESYTNGITEYVKCNPENVDHSVLLVGYGVSADHDHKPYWIIKNSWGTSYGLGGYFLLSAEGDGDSNCVLQQALFPVLT